MRFVDATLRPGKVLEISKDFPSKIKIEAPGLFSKINSSGKDQTSKLPWINCFFDGSVGTNGFVKPNIGDEVWVLNNESNPSQIYWFLKNEDRTDKLKNEIFTDENLGTSGFLDQNIIECIVHREAGTGYASLYFTDGTGWIIRGNSGSYIRIRKDGSIILDNTGENNRTIDICSNSISLGKEGGSDHPAALADKVQDCLDLIYQTLKTVKQAASGNTYTKNIAVAIGNFPDKLKNKIPEILSKEVTLM
jgi:hypothetical protein